MICQYSLYSIYILSSSLFFNKFLKQNSVSWHCFGFLNTVVSRITHLVKYKFEEEKNTEALRNKTCVCITNQKKLQEAADTSTQSLMYKSAAARCTHWSRSEISSSLMLIQRKNRISRTVFLLSFPNLLLRILRKSVPAFFAIWWESYNYRMILKRRFFEVSLLC